MDRTASPAGRRDDCWSEGATEALIRAWGDRYLSLNRGNLRQNDWKEVSDAVNSGANGVRAKKTDVQCKNRIDTLKKKYKSEKSKLPSTSTWKFYSSIDFLIGRNSVIRNNSNDDDDNNNRRKSKSRSKSSSSDEDDFGDQGGEEDEEDDFDAGFDERVVKKRHWMEDVDLSDGAACRELARAILKFGEIYERVESAKQLHMVELEKQRMEFTRELELHRMNLFVEAQLEFEKRNKSNKFGAGSGCTNCSPVRSH